MIKFLLVIGLLAGVAYFATQEFDFGDSDVPATPSVNYPVIDGGGADNVGDETRGVLGN